MLKGLFVLRKNAFHEIYGPSEIDEIKKYVDINEDAVTEEMLKENKSILKDVDVIFSVGAHH